MMRAIVKAYNALRRARINGGIVASVHDELLLEVAVADPRACPHHPRRRDDRGVPRDLSGRALSRRRHREDWYNLVGDEVNDGRDRPERDPVREHHGHLIPPGDRR